MASTPQGQKNILLTADSVTRAAILDVVEAKTTDFMRDLETADDNKLVSGIIAGVGAILAPFNAANEASQQVFRGGLTSVDGNVAERYVQGVTAFANAPTYFLQGILNWDKVERGDFDDTYIQTLKASGNYNPTAVDVMTAVAKAQAAGDPDPIFTALAQFPDDPEADKIIRSLIYRDAYDPQLDELARQIDSANMGSTGQLYATTFTTPDPTKYSEFRGTRGRSLWTPRFWLEVSSRRLVQPSTPCRNWPPVWGLRRRRWLPALSRAWRRTRLAATSTTSRRICGRWTSWRRTGSGLRLLLCASRWNASIGNCRLRWWRSSARAASVPRTTWPGTSMTRMMCF
jgi:hypothetical protein